MNNRNWDPASANQAGLDEVERVRAELQNPRRRVPDLEALVGGLPDERSAEEILEDLELLRKVRPAR